MRYCRLKVTIGMAVLLGFCLRQANADTVALWRFENNFLDSSGNGLHGTPVAAPVFQSLNIPGSATGLRCDGLKDRVFVPDSPQFVLTHSITVEAFIHILGVPRGGSQIVFRGDDRSSKDPYSLALSDGRLLFRVDNETQTSALLSPFPLPWGQTLHVAGTLDGTTGTQRLFINAQEVAAITTQVRPLGLLDPSMKPGLGICGFQSETYNEFFQGVVDEVRISNVALTPDRFLFSGLDLGGPPKLSVGPNSLSFNFQIGGTNPTPQTLLVSSTSSPVPFTATISGGAWLSITPLSGSTPSTLTVSVNPVGLAAGVYNGSIRIDSPVSNSPQTIGVSLTVRETTISTSAASLLFIHDAGSANPGPQNISVTSSGPSISFTASASGGAWLSVSPSQGITPTVLSVKVDATALLPGTYNGSIILVASAASNAVQSVPVVLTVQPRTPRFSAAGVVNVASYAAGLVPGGLVSIFGTGLSGVIGIESAGGARSFKGISVLIGGTPAPLVSIMNQGGQEQINLQAPFELQAGTTTTVEVDNNGKRTAVSGVSVSASQPGIFEILLSAETRVGAVIHASGQLVTPSSPARRGEVVSVFFTGGGALQPAVATGEVGPIPPAVIVLPVIVGVGNSGCVVQFSGYAPGAIGLYQINFEIPSDAPPGSSLNLSVKVGEVYSNTASIAVQ